MENVCILYCIWRQIDFLALYFFFSKEPSFIQRIWVSSSRLKRKPLKLLYYINHSKYKAGLAHECTSSVFFSPWLVCLLSEFIAWKSLSASKCYLNFVKLIPEVAPSSALKLETFLFRAHRVCLHFTEQTSKHRKNCNFHFFLFLSVLSQQTKFNLFSNMRLKMLTKMLCLNNELHLKLRFASKYQLGKQAQTSKEIKRCTVATED